ncbi:MAG: hypothetical protein CL793_06505 [Chloroflexi bacterium]|nr:hypothetical protein [Chloroflexota bacterium]|tara:strand:+ start:1053 stop:1433 length:381 start_codon:yes stop_codon:yes gene_type:complete
MSGIRINVYDIDPVQEREKLEERYGKDNVWDTQEMTKEFSVESFSAPYVTVTRKGKTIDTCCECGGRGYIDNPDQEEAAIAGIRSMSCYHCREAGETEKDCCTGRSQGTLQFQHSPRLYFNYKELT